jgi:hypothetical protein
MPMRYWWVNHSRTAGDQDRLDRLNAAWRAALAGADLAAMGLEGLAGRRVGPFTAAQAGYLVWHRRWVFVGG